MRIGSLVVIAGRYPCQLHPTWHVFVREVVHAFARQSVHVTLINPLPIHRALLGGDPYLVMEDAGDGATVTAVHPRYFSMSKRKFWKWSTFRLTVSAFQMAVRRPFKEYVVQPPDALFGHFMYPAGATAVQLGKTLGVPSFPSAGEISLDTVDPVGNARARRDLGCATGFVANSSHLARLMERKLAVPHDHIGVFPNGVNRRLFFPHDRTRMRRKYNLPCHKFLIAFVGGFEPRKGPRRVEEALRPLEGVGGVFIGTGDEKPAGPNVILYDGVPHEQVPELLSACDVFVLPTTDEGSCNAIIEAMACGLPVISSTGAYNDDILNDEVAIRIDPLNIVAIRSAIELFRDNPSLRGEMARAALEWSVNFDVDKRARDILDFMTEAIERATQRS